MAQCQPPTALDSRERAIPDKGLRHSGSVVKDWDIEAHSVIYLAFQCRSAHLPKVLFPCPVADKGRKTRTLQLMALELLCGLHMSRDCCQCLHIELHQTPTSLLQAACSITDVLTSKQCACSDIGPIQ